MSQPDRSRPHARAPRRLTLGLCLVLGALTPVVAQTTPNPVPMRPAMAMFDANGSFAPMLARVIPGVVAILVTGATAQPVDLMPRRSDGTLGPTPVPVQKPFRAGGSGVIVDRSRGHILTNNHVVEHAIRIEVSLSDGRRMLARLVGRDAATDLAVIEVEDRNLPELAVGDSDQMRVGDLVAAVGNPYGLEGTATLGIVSALMRTDEVFEDFMQIDAAINPGNSGGALVNAHGELIGINTAGPSERGRGSGIGFAIPINMAKAIKAELITHGRVKRGSPGLVVEDLPFEMMDTAKSAPTRGAHIVGVAPGSPAAAAGIKPGGVVVSVADKPVRSATEFQTRIGTVRAGTVLPFVIAIGGERKTYALAVADIVIKAAEMPIPGNVGGIGGAVIGEITLGNPLFGQVRGAQVLDVPVATPAYRTGLAKDDVIVALDGGAIRAPNDLSRLVDRAGMQYRLMIMRAGTPGWLVVTR